MMKINNIRKIFLIGDIHFGVRNNSSEWLDIQKDFLLNFFLAKVDLDFDENRDILIFEGDIFHSRESINIRIQNEAFEIFTILAKKFKRGVFAIIGNHDTYYKDKTDVHSLKQIENLASNITVFENPEVLTINEAHSFLMLPWIEDISKLTTVISEYQSFCPYLICHADIKTFKFNKWIYVEHGLEFSDLSKFRRIYSGHIHHRQERGNVLYTGTPYQMDRGDMGNAKGFYQLRIDGPALMEDFILNTKSPMFVKFDITELLEMNLKQLSDLFNNNFIDVMINVNFANKISIPSFVELISNTKHRKLEFFTYVEQKKDDVNIESEFNPDDGFNLTDIFKMYLKIKDYSREFKIDLAKKFNSVHQSVKQEKTYA